MTAGLLTIALTSLSVLAAFASAFFSFLAIRKAVQFRAESSLPEKISNIPEFLSKQYIDLEFAVKRRGTSTISMTMRDARLLAQKEITPREGETPIAAWERFTRSTLRLGTWQNRYAYEASLGLEWVGAMVFVGAIPPQTALMMNAQIIVEDWAYCRPLVEQVIRGSRDALPSRPSLRGYVSYHRRHAEWLANAAALHLAANWHGPHVDWLLSTLGDLSSIQTRERRIRHFESRLIPPSTKREIRALLRRL